MSTSGDDQHLLTGTRPPAAPRAVKARALAAAKIAYHEPRLSLTDRLWSSRRLHMAWGMAVTLLLLVNLHMALTPTPSQTARVSPSPAPSALAWQCVSDDHQLQPLTRRSGSGLRLKALDRLLLEGPLDSQPARHDTIRQGKGDRV